MKFEGEIKKSLAQNTVDELSHMSNFHYFELEGFKKENQIIKHYFEKAEEQIFNMIGEHLKQTS